jgi:hypothetical protein
MGDGMAHKLREIIKLESLALGISETTREVPCPSCKHKGDFTITRTDAGLLYRCYRAKCDIHGFIPSLGYELATHSEQRLFTPKHFNRPLRPLPPRIRKWLRATYYLTPEQIRKNELKYDYIENRLWQPITSFEGYQLGCTAKKLPREFASDECDIETYLAGVKSIAYWETDTAHLDFPADITRAEAKGRPRGIALVEDKLSAIRVNQFVRCAALGGSNIDDRQIAALSNLTDTIVLALDYDTWEGDGESKSIKLWRKYSLFFKSFQLRLIKNDPKDMTNNEIEQEIVGS